MISQNEISSALLANSYPPLTPAIERTIPAFRSLAKTFER